MNESNSHLSEGNILTYPRHDIAYKNSQMVQKKQDVVQIAKLRHIRQTTSIFHFYTPPNNHSIYNFSSYSNSSLVSLSDDDLIFETATPAPLFLDYTVPLLYSLLSAELSSPLQVFHSHS